MLVSVLRRYVFPPSQVSHNGITTAAGNNSAQNDVLVRENARLRNELEVYVEKAARLQKVRQHRVMSLAVCRRNIYPSVSHVMDKSPMVFSGFIYGFYLVECPATRPTLCLSNMPAMA